uniref:Uncharacterized protein n=1 Tax=Janibacter limosus TaxID=53458 RepID=A0AC61U8R2_9MICO|nr:hypothetical protein [Janibacter limosus]
MPDELDEAAQPGVRIKARFAGRDPAGYVVERSDVAEHTGRLAPLRTVVSPEQVLTPHVLEVARRLARHRAGTVMDVLRLAIPPRHARAEKALPIEPPHLDQTPGDAADEGGSPFVADGASGVGRLPGRLGSVVPRRGWRVAAGSVDRRAIAPTGDGLADGLGRGRSRCPAVRPGERHRRPGPA